MQRGHDALIEALVSEVGRRKAKITLPRPTVDLGCSLTAFAREKLAAMVRGLFPRREWARVLGLLENSVVFLAPNDMESVIRGARDLDTAWSATNLYLTSIGAKPSNGDARRIVGFSVETTCYVSIEYFVDKNPFADIHLWRSKR